MPKLTHTQLIISAGLVWFIVGIWLLSLGLKFLVLSSQAAGGELFLLPIFSRFGVDFESSALLLVALGLFLGYGKSKAIFAKNVEKTVSSIRLLPAKAPLSSVYTKKYLVIIALMMGIGFCMKWFSVPLDLRGLIDVAVGSALINGAVLYFRKLSVASSAI